MDGGGPSAVLAVCSSKSSTGGVRFLCSSISNTGHRLHERSEAVVIAAWCSLAPDSTSLDHNMVSS